MTIAIAYCGYLMCLLRVKLALLACYATSYQLAVAAADIVDDGCRRYVIIGDDRPTGTCWVEMDNYAEKIE